MTHVSSETELNLRGFLVGITRDERDNHRPLDSVFKSMSDTYLDLPMTTRDDQLDQFEQAAWIAFLAVYLRHESAYTWLIHARGLYKKLSGRKPDYFVDLGTMLNRMLRPYFPSLLRRYMVVRYVNKD